MDHLASAGKNIRGRTIYEVMKEHGLVGPCPARTKKRNRVSFERQYPNTMWHTGWHAIRDFCMRDLNLIT